MPFRRINNNDVANILIGDRLAFARQASTHFRGQEVLFYFAMEVYRMNFYYTHAGVIQNIFFTQNAPLLLNVFQCGYSGPSGRT